MSNRPKSKASMADLGAIHSLICNHFAGILEQGGDIPPSILKEIREFLKDNGIEASILPNDNTGLPANSLPFPSQEAVLSVVGA